MEVKKLDFGETLKDSVAIGVKNAPSVIAAVALWLITIWIPYLNVGTTIAITLLPTQLAKGEIVNPLGIFDSKYRRYIGEYRYKDIVTPGGIPAIVDEDLFNRVQQRFEQNKIAHGRPAKEDVSYLLTTKLFCGKCGTLMGGESGTSHMGNTYYYYKCGNAKRHGKAHCDLKAIRKEPLERFVVETAIKVIFSDEIIERLIDLVMEAQQQENTRLPVLKEQLRDTEKRLANLLEAIEQGILTPTTKQRLDELEARKEALNTSILEEELKKPVLTREWIRFWLEKFRKGDVGSTEHQRQIIDTFVNSVYVFDDRVVLNFNFTDDAKTVTREEVLGSSAVDNAPPNVRPFT